jgi:hypothetical protein
MLADYMTKPVQCTMEENLGNICHCWQALDREYDIATGGKINK